MGRRPSLRSWIVVTLIVIAASWSLVGAQPPPRTPTVRSVTLQDLETRRPTFVVTIGNDDPTLVLRNVSIAVVAPNREWPTLASQVSGLARGRDTTLTFRVPQPLATGFHSYEVRTGNDPDRPLGTILHADRFLIPIPRDYDAAISIVSKSGSASAPASAAVRITNLRADATPRGEAVLSVDGVELGASPFDSIPGRQSRTFSFVTPRPLRERSHRIVAELRALGPNGPMAWSDPVPGNDRDQTSLDVRPRAGPIEPVMVEVPDLNGFSEAQAREVLLKRRLWLRNVTRIANVLGANGTVTDQNPAPHSKLARGKAVDVDISYPPPTWWYVVGVLGLGGLAFAGAKVFRPKPQPPNLPRVDLTANPGESRLELEPGDGGRSLSVEFLVEGGAGQLEMEPPQPDEKEGT